MCVFCDPDLDNVVFEGLHWRIKRNIRPYKGVSPHFVIVARKHFTSTKGWPDAMKVEYIDLISKVTDEYALRGCGIVMRLGDPAYHGGSEEHVHYHVLVPDGTVPVEKIFYKERA